MNKQLIAVVFVLNCAVCEAQRTTELYIPIGKSPGLSISGKTIVGFITKVESDQITIGDKVVFITDKTKIFLDRSAVRKSNSYGTRSDVKVGAYVEAHASEWIKIRSN